MMSNWCQKYQAADACKTGGSGKPFRYIQAGKVVPIKPVPQYQPPSGRMESSTTYNQSYRAIDPCWAYECRPAPTIRNQTNAGDFEAATVTKISYPGHHCVDPPKKIVPVAVSKRTFIGEESFSSETSHKRDFKPNYNRKRDLIMPVGLINGPRGRMDNVTTSRSSFMPINIRRTPPPKTLRPIDNHEKPSDSIDSDTTYKLSYISLRPCAMEDFTWLKKSSFNTSSELPKIESTYQAGYLANQNPRNIRKRPEPCLKLGDGEICDSKTSYRESYVEQRGGRPPPIKHASKLALASAPLEGATVYNMTFSGHCNESPSMPIHQADSNLRFGGSFETGSTYQMSYLYNNQTRREAMIPKDGIMRASGPFEKSSLARLSYVPHQVGNIERSKAFKPNMYKQSTNIEAPTHYDTTQKLSFMPFCSQPKQRPVLPRSSFGQPEGPICAETIQRTSFRPPGKFVAIDESSCHD